METRSKLVGTKDYERNGHYSPRKKTGVNKRIFVITLIVLIFLLLGKVVMSGLYFRLGPILLSSSKMALAEEDETDKVRTLELKEQMLRKKEMELKEREEELDKREKNLIPLQREIDTKLEELNALQTNLTSYAKKLAEREKALNDAKMDHLVALYGAMEPARAAVIMAQLNMDTVVRILSNMKGKSAGLIVAMMEPAKGAMISERLSQLE